MTVNRDVIGTYPDGRRRTIPCGGYPAGRPATVGVVGTTTTLSTSRTYIPINHDGAVIWIYRRYEGDTWTLDVSYPVPQEPASMHGVATVASLTSPVHLKDNLMVVSASNPSDSVRLTPNDTITKSSRFDGRTSLYNEAGKLIGDIDSAELRRHEVGE